MFLLFRSVLTKHPHGADVLVGEEKRMAKNIDTPDYLLNKLDSAIESLEESKRKTEKRNQEQRTEYEERLLSEKRKQERWEEWFKSRPEEVINAEIIIQWINNKIFSNNELVSKLTSLVEGWSQYNIGSLEFYNIFSYFTGHVFSHNRREVVYVSIWPKISKIKMLYYTSGLFGGSRHETNLSSTRDMVKHLSSETINRLYNHIKSGAIWDSLDEEFNRIKNERRF
ncbi:MAG: hypothetical protein A3C69_01255 [Candidatus Yanofskybacteria bacterium RIFCSPHIGHO2_02_FULL_43_12]|nr:MAG: hypothetical protein A3C69_01255 [Candidatus Yanofskybacteria bacterium RIFCSPHIGHO2_02_FULL_43_12]